MNNKILKNSNNNNKVHITISSKNINTNREQELSINEPSITVSFLQSKAKLPI
jgi:hypothetical protein